MNDEIAENYLKDAIKSFRGYKTLAEKAVAQISDAEFFRALDEEGNSVAVVMRHMAGNMRSRWRDFLTTDGEKPDRNRDAEFVINEGTTREEVMRDWEEGWQFVFGAVEPLRPEDLSRKVFIRGEAHTIVEAINRQLTHYAYHTGQIVFLSKHFKSSEWKSLSIPRGMSEAYNPASGAKRPQTEGRGHESATEAEGAG